VTTIGGLIGEFMTVLLYLIAGMVGVKLYYAVFTGQIDLAAGRPGALADAVMNILGGLVVMTFAIHAQTIGASLGSYVEGLSVDSPGSVMAVVESVVIRPMSSLMITLAVSTFFATVVFYGLRGQMASLTGNFQGLGQSWTSMFGAVLFLSMSIAAIAAIVRLF
jgi:hypothetical protein